MVQTIQGTSLHHRMQVQGVNLEQQYKSLNKNMDASLNVWAVWSVGLIGYIKKKKKKGFILNLVFYGVTHPVIVDIYLLYSLSAYICIHFIHTSIIYLGKCHPVGLNTHTLIHVLIIHLHILK